MHAETPGGPASDGRRFRPFFGILYAAIGVLLGVGAPLGALALRIAGGAPIGAELAANRFFYVYQLIGTCLIFGAAGLVVGRRADRLRIGRDLYRLLAERDPLTGLVNARAFFERFRRAVDHARRFREPLSLLVIDVDRLKALNDRFGHASGSAALVRVGRVLSETKREDDMASRWGGDEFALLMPGADAGSARRQAETVLERLRDEARAGDVILRDVSVTIGVATSADGQSSEGLFERADRALLDGKRAGRGQVREGA
jgi:diguanylate cyclase (GGDEF)-like protein